MITGKQIQAQLRMYGVRPSRRMGQSFLVDPNLVTKIAGYGRDADVLEVGSGVGNLTLALARVARSVVSVEIDGRLAEIARTNTKSCDNVRIIHSDFLSLNVAGLLSHCTSWRVVANLPYSVSQQVLLRLLEVGPQPECMWITLQREVVERICASPRTKQYGLLSVMVAFHADSKTLFHMPAHVFHPRPKVESSLLKLIPHDRYTIDQRTLAAFKGTVRLGFQSRRKPLRNALRPAFARQEDRALVLEALAEVGLSPSVRAEELSVDEFVALASRLLDHGLQIPKT